MLNNCWKCENEGNNERVMFFSLDFDSSTMISVKDALLTFKNGYECQNEGNNEQVGCFWSILIGFCSRKDI